MIVTIVQDFAGLDVTGELDDETVELMNTPRCGVKDQEFGTEERDDNDVGGGRGRGRRRGKRYVHQGSKWKVDRLTWRITKYPTSSRNLKKDDVTNKIKQARHTHKAQKVPFRNFQ